MLGAAGATSPIPPQPGEAATKGFIPQPPSPGPCFTSRSPSPDQSTLRFPLRSLNCSQRATRCCQQPLASGMGLSPPHQGHLLLAAPLVGKWAGTWPGLWTLGIAQHRAPAQAALVPVFAVLPCSLLRCCRVFSCLASPVLACGWRVTAALGTAVVMAMVWELGRAMVRGPSWGGHEAFGCLLSPSVRENTVIRQKEGK